MGAFVAATGKWSNPFNLAPKSLTFLVLSAVATGASWVCYYRALQFGEASKVAPVDKLSVVLVAVFAVIFLRERPTLREWLGIGCVAFGILLLALKKSEPRPNSPPAQSSREQPGRTPFAGGVDFRNDKERDAG